jgi:hypothetical protein
MKQGMMKGVAIAVFVAAMTLAGSASAAQPNIPCTSSLNGYTTYTTSGGWRYYYRCQTPTWIFVRACPIGGGSCVY